MPVKPLKPFSSLELDALLLVNCARIAFAAPMLSSFPKGSDKTGDCPVDHALNDLVSFVQAYPGPGTRWYLYAPKGATAQMGRIALAWQTSVQHVKHPLGQPMLRVKCPHRLAKFLSAFNAGKLPHLEA